MTLLGRNRKSRPGLRRVPLALVASGMALALWAFVLEPASLRESEYEIVLAGWPSACDGLRIAVLADLHVGSPFNGLDKLERIVRVAGPRIPTSSCSSATT